MIAEGIFGRPLATPLQRCMPEMPHAFTADTQTEEPPGIDAGKRMEHEVPEGVSTAPPTEVVQVYEVAPGTGLILKTADAFGHTFPLPLIVPGVAGVFVIVMHLSVVL